MCGARRTYGSSILVVACLFVSCSKQAPPEDAARCATGVGPLPARIQRGMSLAHNYQAGGTRGYGSETSAATLAELATLGVQWVSLTPFGFMRRLDEPTVHFIGDYPGGETDARMSAVIAQAKALGLRILLKPHLWVAGGRWRGEIGFAEPADWGRWFESYTRWILHYADMAERHRVDTLVIGVELRSSQREYANRWRALVDAVRDRFGGRITYSANWDDAGEVPWWDAVDAIGVQFYPPLADTGSAAVSTVRARIASQLDGLEVLAARYDKPILFTEVGYRASSDALVRPHEWPERAEAASTDPKLQALGYRAFIEAIRARPRVHGVYWWKWFTDPDTDEEGPAGFSPRGKDAEAVLRAAYGGRCGPPG